MSKAVERILANKKTKNPILDLSECNLIELPPALSECVWLIKLKLDNNEKLKDLSPLSTLIKLQQLSFRDTDVHDLSSLLPLTDLIELNAVTNRKDYLW